MADLEVRRTGQPRYPEATAFIPGDKSISQRLLIVGALSKAPVKIAGLNLGHTVSVLVDSLERLGAHVVRGQGTVTVGQLPRDDDADIPLLHFGGSSAAARMMCGVLAGLGRSAIIDGSASLRNRPMGWIIDPLRSLGARIDYLGQEQHLPVRVAGGALHSGRVQMAVASAQAKSAIMLAALAANVDVEIDFTVRSRDHTERLLDSAGCRVVETDGCIRIATAPVLMPDMVTVPRDPSAAAYIAAYHLLSGQPGELVLDRICLNPTRLGFFELLKSSGLPISYHPAHTLCGEQTGEIVVPGSAGLTPLRLAEATQVQNMIDEIPIACAVATMIRGQSLFENAAELVFKETNRLETTRAMLVAFGAKVDVGTDGLSCLGGMPLHAAVVPGFGDHRISMSAAVLAGSLPGVSRITDGDCFDESFPRFDDALGALGLEVQRKPQRGEE